jgi:tetratricopeptide (TPR) repeat protein
MYTRALQGKEEALGPKHTSTLDTVNNLGALYKDQGKLAEAEAIYTRTLQGYEETLGLKLVSSYIPALNTMVNLSSLYFKISEKGMAKTVYIKALSGFATVQGPLSDIYRELERRLEVLDLAPAELKIPKDTST